MELKYKIQKIRDFITYQFNILPARIDVERHDVFIEIRKVDLERRDITEEDIITAVSPLIDRRVKIHLI